MLAASFWTKTVWIFPVYTFPLMVLLIAMIIFWVLIRRRQV